MTDDTTVDTAAAAPVDQAPAPAPAAPTAVDVARAVLDQLRAEGAAPYPWGGDAPSPTSQAVKAFVAPAAAPQDAAPLDEPAAVYKPGFLAIYEHDHFGKTRRQIMLVVGVYEQEITDPKTGAVTGTQQRLRMLPIGAVDAYADLPADELTPADSFDWEAAA